MSEPTQHTNEKAQRITTPTGIPIEECDTCGHRHPVTRKHCSECGLAHLFPCATALYGYDQRGDLYQVVNGGPVPEEVVAYYAESFPETIYFAGPVTPPEGSDR